MKDDHRYYIHDFEGCRLFLVWIEAICIVARIEPNDKHHVDQIPQEKDHVRHELRPHDIVLCDIPLEAQNRVNDLNF